jgi:hypothetical protein
MYSRLSIALSCLLIAFATNASAQAPPYYWSHRVGNNLQEYSGGVAVDPSGNVYLAGDFTGTVNVGGADLTSAGSTDIFLVKYGPNGVHKWSKRFGSLNDDRVLDIAMDASGNVAITGTYFNGIDFGGGVLAVNGLEGYVAKFNTAGSHVFSQHLGGASLDSGNNVAFDGSGNVLVTGYFTGTADFGGSNLVSAGDHDIFVAKYNPSGVHQWSARYGSTGTDDGNGITADASGNVIVTGFFSGTVNFGGGGLISAGGPDIFVAKYFTSGTYQWSSRYGSTGNDFGRGLAADGFDNVYLAADFSGTVNFGVSNLISAGGFDIALAKYNSLGICLWNQRFGNTTNDASTTVVADAAGNVALTGYHTQTIDFGGGGIPGASDLDIYIAKFNAAGAHQWSSGYGNIGGFDVGQGLAMDASGNVALAGYFTGSVDFGGGLLTAQGQQDVFIARYASPNEPLITAITDVGNDQGRAARISFLRSGHDKVGDATPVAEYAAFRRIGALPALSVAEDAADAPGALAIPGYEFVGAIPAYGESSYNMIVSTLADSTVALGQYYSVFFVRAAGTSPTTFFDSPPDSGYSLDNLAPGVPGAFAYSAGQLSWNESTAKDLDYFSVYGSDTNDFGSATLIDYSVAPAMDVNASPYVFYFVTATDFSGNEGKPAVINTLSEVNETPKHYVLSISAYPNPFNPETTIRYTVPSKGRITVDVFDARGAHVAMLVDAEMEAGAYTVTWNGRDNRGAATGSGVYFGRVTSPAGAQSYKMTLLK